MPGTDSATQARIEKLQAACANAPHGRRARYVAGCRCLLCRAANSRYQVELDRRHAAGDTNPLVSAEPARLHLLALSAKNVGYKSAADAAGVSRSGCRGIVSGRRKQCRKSTLEAILAVDAGARSGGALVAAGPTWKLLHELIGRGYTRAWIAQQLGAKKPALQIHKGWITAETEARVRRLYNLLNAGKIRRAS